MKRLRHPLAAAVALASLSGLPVLAADSLSLPDTTVSASSHGSRAAELSSSVEVLRGDDLVTGRQATLGDTLSGLPGVHSSGFGPGVGRPVIRGLDGARVRVLSDGVGVLDASTSSPDHAITSEMQLLEQVEVIKGPATLMYGGGAIGGVVNLIDRRVPTYIPERGIEADLELRGNTVADERAGAVGVTAGSGQFALRLEGSKLEADPYRIPGSPSRQAGAFNESDSAAFGLSWIGERGYLGVAYSEQNREYGLLAHEHADCHTHGPTWHCGGHDHDHDDDHGHDHDHDHAAAFIDMRQQRWDLRGEYQDPFAGFEKVRLRMAHTDYQHKEIEGSQVGTRFDNRGSEARLELTHRPLAGWRGVIGGQTTRRDFSALGEEAYVPATLTSNHALFLVEELQLGNWRHEIGLRHEWQNVDVKRTAADVSHRGTSISAGTTWRFVPDHALFASLSRSQRLPTAEELYAAGPHAATRTVELGNANLREETGYNLEVGLRKLAGTLTYSLSAFRNQVDDFIYAADAGYDPGGGYRVVEYRQDDALLRGFEASLGVRATDALQVTLFGDSVRGKLRNGGGDLPRIPADRYGVRLEQRLSSQLTGELESYRVRRQGNTAAHETDTGGYSMLNAGLSYRGHSQVGVDYLLYARANNLLNDKARQHTSYIKDEVLLPGRNLTVGMRFSF
ncbi:TonB-dependent receptor [Pseudomonas sp. MYb185]|uniref:TonB-dependent receptor n=1 Tax=Pseudomonas sp. MYb185 TaxID=1848729 RepID=UPI000CFD6B36|nr:TonB-dependent receptor [Pseudomonas sp. MYb185]PRB77509.1 TonB-dependent receptor [Pseudomonas sp. MYb185]